MVNDDWNFAAATLRATEGVVVEPRCLYRGGISNEHNMREGGEHTHVK